MGTQQLITSTGMLPAIQGWERENEFIPAAQLNPSSVFQLESLHVLSFIPGKGIHEPWLRLAEHLRRFDLHQILHLILPPMSQQQTSDPPRPLRSLLTLGHKNSPSATSRINATFKSLCLLIHAIVVFFTRPFSDPLTGELVSISAVGHLKQFCCCLDFQTQGKNYHSIGYDAIIQFNPKLEQQLNQTET